jgi:tRNA-Thr(GGU) m(6)t(6)A37 methyltransferase TsaA
VSDARDPAASPGSLTLTPIGVVRSPFADRASAPRQPAAAAGAPGEIVLYPGRNLEHAVEDLGEWSMIWVLFWFHLNPGWRPKVLPPRSDGRRRGVLATRSPHRPNPIGLSALRLEEVRGLTLVVRDLDLVDGTPVLDVKPYVPYTDAHPDARSGWLETLAAPADPGPAYELEWSERARAELAWLREEHAVDLETPITQTLSIGPQPHPYRRIRRVSSGGLVLAVKEWRVAFRVEGRRVLVDAVTTGYRPSQLASSAEPPIAMHRAFVARFGG